MVNTIRIGETNFEITRYDMQDLYDCTIQANMETTLQIYNVIKDIRPCVITFLENTIEKASGQFVYRNQHIEIDDSGSRGFFSLFVVSFNII